ncbi:MAG TPA: WD40 repeat domain-containing protein, partial [Gemmataceae bacterium]|nr:WD40 repeat domain-containing protein [Gemmataceae bacterium]
MSSRAILRAVLATLAVLPPAVGANELPPRAVARIGDHRFYHGPGVRCAALSPDGSRVASAAAVPIYFHHATDKDREPYDRTIVLWDAATGERLREIRVPRGTVDSLAFSPNGKRIAAVGGSGITLSEVETGRLLWRSEGDKWDGYPQFSTDGKELRVGERDGPLTAWDVATGKQLRRWRPPAGPSEWVKERESIMDVAP